MALFGDNDGKTEKPTPSRLTEVRERGDTPLSRELVQGGVMLVAAIMMMWFGGWLVDAFAQVLRTGLTVGLDDRQLTEVPGICRELLHALATVGPPFALFVGTLVAATALIGYGQIGLRWSNQVLGFKLERLNPLTNWKRVFNVQAVVRTAFAVLKLGVLVAVLWLTIGHRLPALLHLHEQPFDVAAGEVADLAITVLLWVAAVVTALAAADFFWQRFSFEKRNMMSRQEVEDERKRSEGDPAIKMRQRRARNELLRSRMMADVPKADVVVTNPTHFSVALRYDRKRDAAPVVVAKGMDEIALQIRELARANGVPLMEDPPLARALFRAVKVGQTVPERFYQAVATVLGHVYRLKHRTA
ncbi:MAG: flagellar biosynthesis protein FlhB [Planctomycetes bacterium]|nr:flagellar biosynthesis protein FlhB [Planctomycetota bacterium]